MTIDFSSVTHNGPLGAQANSTVAAEGDRCDLESGEVSSGGLASTGWTGPSSIPPGSDLAQHVEGPGNCNVHSGLANFPVRIRPQLL